MDEQEQKLWCDVYAIVLSDRVDSVRAKQQAEMAVTVFRQQKIGFNPQNRTMHDPPRPSSHSPNVMSGGYPMSNENVEGNQQ